MKPKVIVIVLELINSDLTSLQHKADCLAHLRKTWCCIVLGEGFRSFLYSLESQRGILSVAPLSGDTFRSVTNPEESIVVTQTVPNPDDKTSKYTFWTRKPASSEAKYTLLCLVWFHTIIKTTLAELAYPWVILGLIWSLSTDKL